MTLKDDDVSYTERVIASYVAGILCLILVVPTLALFIRHRRSKFVDPIYMIWISYFLNRAVISLSGFFTIASLFSTNEAITFRESWFCRKAILSVTLPMQLMAAHHALMLCVYHGLVIFLPARYYGWKNDASFRNLWYWILVDHCIDLRLLWSCIGDVWAPQKVFRCKFDHSTGQFHACTATGCSGWIDWIHSNICPDRTYHASAECPTELPCFASDTDVSRQIRRSTVALLEKFKLQLRRTLYGGHIRPSLLREISFRPSFSISSKDGFQEAD